jgi:hypothetical protein
MLGFPVSGAKPPVVSLSIVFYHTSDLHHYGPQLIVGGHLPFLWYLLWSEAGFVIKPEGEGDWFTLVSFTILEGKRRLDGFPEQQVIVSGGSQHEIAGETLPLGFFDIRKIRGIIAYSRLH